MRGFESNMTLIELRKTESGQESATKSYISSLDGCSMQKLTLECVEDGIIYRVCLRHGSLVIIGPYENYA